MESRWSLPGTGAGETEAKGRRRRRDGALAGWGGGRRRGRRRRKEDGRRGGGGGGRRARVWRALLVVREGRRRRGLRRLWSLDDTSMGGLLYSTQLSLKSSATLQLQAKQ